MAFSFSFGFRREFLKRCDSPESKSLMLSPLRLQEISGLTVDELQLPHLLPAISKTCLQYPEIFFTRIWKLGDAIQSYYWGSGLGQVPNLSNKFFTDTNEFSATVLAVFRIRIHRIQGFGSVLIFYGSGSSGSGWRPIRIRIRIRIQWSD